jgi:Rrf2 family protein
MAILASSEGTGRYSISRLKVGDASLDHLSKVLQRLVRAGLVSSRRGARGGFMLTRPAEEITLLDIWTALEGPVDQVSCPLHDSGCPIGRCVFGTRIEESNRKITEYFAETTLASFARSGGEPDEG